MDARFEGTVPGSQVAKYSACRDAPCALGSDVTLHGLVAIILLYQTGMESARDGQSCTVDIVLLSLTSIQGMAQTRREILGTYLV